MEIIYDKLVRDNIPEKIIANGGQPFCRKLDDEEYWKYLLKKYGLWLFFMVSVILTAVSLTVAFDNANNLFAVLYIFLSPFGSVMVTALSAAIATAL